jgi:acetyl-CoA C-acetyltransferase
MPSTTHTGPGMAHAQQSAGRDRERNAEAEFRGAEDIIACSSPMSIRALKETVLKGLDEATLRAALEAQFGCPAMRALFRSDDLREGPLAFAQKRTLLWKGR